MQLMFAHPNVYTQSIIRKSPKLTPKQTPYLSADSHKGAGYPTPVTSRVPLVSSTRRHERSAGTSTPWLCSSDEQCPAGVFDATTREVGGDLRSLALPLLALFVMLFYTLVAGTELGLCGSREVTGCWAADRRGARPGGCLGCPLGRACTRSWGREERGGGKEGEGKAGMHDLHWLAGGGDTTERSDGGQPWGVFARSGSMAPGG